MESRPLSILVHVLSMFISWSESTFRLLHQIFQCDWILPWEKITWSSQARTTRACSDICGKTSAVLGVIILLKGVFFLYYVCSIICETNHNSVYYCMPSCACCANCISSSLQKRTERWNWDICCCWRLFLFEFENKLNQPVWIGWPWLALAGPGLAGCSSRTSSPAISA